MVPSGMPRPAGALEALLTLLVECSWLFVVSIACVLSGTLSSRSRPDQCSMLSANTELLVFYRAAVEPADASSLD